METVQKPGLVEITPDLINIEAVFRAKNPRLLPLIPGFVIKYLKRIIHQDEINRMVYENRDKMGLEFVKTVLEHFNIHSGVRGLENIDPKGRYILASNHPLGGIDGMALMNEVGRIRKDIVFPVNDILLFLPQLRPLFIPINKHGSNNENVKIINDTFSSDTAILFFPAGLVSRQRNGVIEDIPWKKTFITKAKQYRRDVVPVHITGRLSGFFYRLANLRKFLGIKANIEMLYLADEMFRQEGNSISITFGKTIPYQTFNRSRSDAAWAAQVRSFVYEMYKKDNPNLEFHP